MGKLERMFASFKNNETPPGKEIPQQPVLAIAHSITETVKAPEVFELDGKEAKKFSFYFAHPLVDLTLHHEKYSPFLLPRESGTPFPIISTPKQSILQRDFPSPLFFSSDLPPYEKTYQQALYNAARGTFLQTLTFLSNASRELRKREEKEYDLVFELIRDVAARVTNSITVEPAIPYTLYNMPLPPVQLTEFLRRDKETIHQLRTYA